MGRYRPAGWTPIEFTEYWSPDGEILRFDTQSRFLISETGQGMPGIKYISQTGPLQHGETIYDYRLQPRIIQMVFRENACSRQGYWDIRANILNLLRPNRQTTGFQLGTLLKILPDKTKRAINVMIEQGPEFAARNPSRWDEWAITEALRFIAPDPSFYDPTTVELSWASQTSDQLVLPVTFDDDHIVFSAEEGDVITGWEITYPGTWLSYPSFILTGPLDQPQIVNETTGETLDLSEHDIVEGETVSVSLEFGNKTITSSVHGNILKYLSSDSDLATFHIAPDPEAPGGVNEISILGTGVLSGVTNVELSYNVRYIGI